jgi:UDP-N-acetylglucosamine--N-acetylmuramyl-(pentapeptide) pyrophosphoryl-undecaprenol N-acetylglucosamine transferase
MRNIVIACGGTGGHLTPGIALAQSLEEKGYPCWMFISNKMVDSRLAENYPELSFERVPGAPFLKNPLGLGRFAKGLVSSYFHSLKFYRNIGADALFGFGGFTSVGPALAARSRGIPVFLHEANRAVGRTIRLLRKKANRLYLPEGIRMDGVSSKVVRNLGYPLRREFRRVPRERARRNLGVGSSERLLVVLGGSQGAASLNQWAKQHLEAFAADGISVYCLTGMGNESSGVVEMTADDGSTVPMRFVPFSDEMSNVLSAADMVISRAGAGTISEIVRCRVPSILVPYPFAADDHQALNASFIEQKGAAIVCPQNEIGKLLFKEARDVMFNEEFRAVLRRNLVATDPGDVVSDIVFDVTNVLQESCNPGDVVAGALPFAG